MAGIREFIAQELGFDTNDPQAKANVNTLIEGYSRNNEGHVNPNKIVNDVKAVANNIIDNIAKAADGYDFRHEVIDCGKDRQEEAIETLGGTAASECLPNEYYDNIDKWASAIYDAAGNLFEERAFGNGIEGYRDFVNNTPYHNIDAVASALGKETETVKFIVENGNEKDFHTLMMDIRPNANDPDAMESAVWTDYTYPSEPLNSGDNGTTVHGCPRDLSDRIFEAAKTLESENGGIDHFNRDEIMSGLKGINRAEDMTGEEKISLQADYMTAHLEHTVPHGFDYAVREQTDDKFESLSGLLHVEQDAKNEAIERRDSLAGSISGNTERITPAELEASVKSAFSDVFSEHGLKVVQIDENRYSGTITLTSSTDDSTGMSHHIEIPAEGLIKAMDDVIKPYEDAANSRIESIRENGAENGTVEKHVTDIYDFNGYNITKDSVDTNYTINGSDGQNVTVHGREDAENGHLRGGQNIATDYPRISSYMDTYDATAQEHLTESEWNALAEKLDASAGDEIHDTMINGTVYNMDLSQLNDSEYFTVERMIGYDDNATGSIELFVSAVSGKDFDSDQCRELRSIVNDVLSDEEIMFIANPDYDSNIMHELSVDFTHGISIENAGLYLDNDLTGRQREAVRDAIREGMSPEDIRAFSSGDYDANQMHDIMNSIEKGADSGRIGTYISPDENRQINSVILSGLESGFSGSVK